MYIGANRHIFTYYMTLQDLLHSKGEFYKLIKDTSAKYMTYYVSPIRIGSTQRIPRDFSLYKVWVGLGEHPPYYL